MVPTGYKTGRSEMVAPAKLPVASDIMTRNGDLTKDGLVLNGIVDQDTLEGTVLRKRPGFTYTAVDLEPGQGVHVDSQHQYEIRAGRLYVDGVFKTNVDLTDLVSVYDFADSGNLTPTPFMTFHGEKTIIYKWDITTQTLTNSSVSGAGSRQLVRGYVQLDGAFYVMDDLGRIWGSAILDLTFDPLNQITMPLEDGVAVAITRHYDHIIAFGSTTTAVFVDAGNAVGSPLQEATGYFKHNGCEEGFTLVRVNEQLTFASRSDTGYLKISRLDGLQLSDISTPAVEKYLNNPGNIIGGAYALALRDRWCYVLEVSYNQPSTSKDYVTHLVYDNRFKIWYQWQFSTTDAFTQVITDATLTASTTDACTYTTPYTEVIAPEMYLYVGLTFPDTHVEYYPISSLIGGVLTIRIPYSTLGTSFTATVNLYSSLFQATAAFGLSWSKGVIQNSDGSLLTLNLTGEDTYTDTGGSTNVPILFRTRTSETDFETLDLKSLENLDLLADMSDGTLYLRLTLDDYQTYQAWRASNLQARLRFTDLGSFVRMALDVCTLDSFSFRLRRIEVRITNE